MPAPIILAPSRKHILKNDIWRCSAADCFVRNSQAPERNSMWIRSCEKTNTFSRGGARIASISALLTSLFAGKRRSTSGFRMPSCALDTPVWSTIRRRVCGLDRQFIETALDKLRQAIGRFERLLVEGPEILDARRPPPNAAQGRSDAIAARRVDNPRHLDR
jgi:hypothetical protein